MDSAFTMTDAEHRRVNGNGDRIFNTLTKKVTSIAWADQRDEISMTPAEQGGFHLPNTQSPSFKKK